MDTLKILQDKFPGVMVVKPTVAGKLLNQSHQASYNQVSAGRFPLPLIIDHLGRKMVRLTDIAAYIDGLQTVPAGQPKGRKPITGRPAKRLTESARSLGVTVSELRSHNTIKS